MKLNLWQFHLVVRHLRTLYCNLRNIFLQYIEVQGEPKLCKRSICPIYTCQGKSTDAEGWKLDYVKSIQPLAIRYLEKLKLSQESLSDEVSLFQQLLKFFYFCRFLCMGWGCFEYKIIADSAQTEYCTTFHCPSVCVSQAWHLNFSQLFDDLGHENHVFSESM